MESLRNLTTPAGPSSQVAMEISFSPAPLRLRYRRNLPTITGLNLK